MSAKLSYQLTKNNRLVYAWQRGTKAQPQNNADRFTPLESTRDYMNPTAIQKIELQSMISPRVLVNAVARLQRVRHRLRRGPLVRAGRCAAAPGSRDDVEYGLCAAASEQDARSLSRPTTASASSPLRSFAGKHEFKTGISIYLDKSSDGYSNNLACNCILYTDTIGGVPNTPSQIRIYNTPVVPDGSRQHLRLVHERQLAALEQVTVNLGVRVGAAALVPARAVVSAARATGRPYSRPDRYQQIDVQKLTRAVPRMGLAWDLGGKSGCQGDVRPLQLHARGHIRRRLQQECDRERRIHLARSERRQALQPGEVEPQPEQHRLQEHHRGQQSGPQSEPEIAQHLGNHGELRARAGGEHWVSA